MDIPPDVADAIREVCRDFDQSEAFRKQFETYFENLIHANARSDDLRDLIEQVELGDEVEVPD